MEPKESFWGLVSHFLSDLTHFDGKFFTSLRYLILRPGFLASEYMKGRRASYLNPVRMYLFTSAFFFLIFASVYSPGKLMPRKEGVRASLGQTALDSLWQTARQEGESALMDSAIHELKGEAIDINQARDTAVDSAAALSQSHSNPLFQKYPSISAYDSAQKKLPAAQRDKWSLRQFMHKKIDLENRYRDDQTGMVRDLLSHFIHLFPYLLFISLPLFALFLKLLYIRHRAYYLADHIIFLGYLYIFTFLFLLLFFALNFLQNRTGWGFIGWVQFVYVLYGVSYAYRGLRNFYGQTRRKTILKFVLLNILASVSLLLLFILFLGISVFQI